MTAVAFTRLYAGGTRARADTSLTCFLQRTTRPQFHLDDVLVQRDSGANAPDAETGVFGCSDGAHRLWFRTELSLATVAR